MQAGARSWVPMRMRADPPSSYDPAYLYLPVFQSPRNFLSASHSLHSCVWYPDTSLLQSPSCLLSWTSRLTDNPSRCHLQCQVGSSASDPVRHSCYSALAHLLFALSGASSQRHNRDLLLHTRLTYKVSDRAFKLGIGGRRSE